MAAEQCHFKMALSFHRLWDDGMVPSLDVRRGDRGRGSTFGDDWLVLVGEWGCQCQNRSNDWQEERKDE